MNNQVPCQICGKELTNGIFQVYDTPTSYMAACKDCFEFIREAFPKAASVDKRLFSLLDDLQLAYLKRNKRPTEAEEKYYKKLLNDYATLYGT